MTENHTRNDTWFGNMTNKSIDKNASKRTLGEIGGFFNFPIDAKKLDWGQLLTEVGRSGEHGVIRHGQSTNISNPELLLKQAQRSKDSGQKYGDNIQTSEIGKNSVAESFNRVRKKSTDLVNTKRYKDFHLYGPRQVYFRDLVDTFMNRYDNKVFLNDLITYNKIKEDETNSIRLGPSYRSLSSGFNNSRADRLAKRSTIQESYYQSYVSLKFKEIRPNIRTCQNFDKEIANVFTVNDPANLKKSTALICLYMLKRLRRRAALPKPLHEAAEEFELKMRLNFKIIPEKDRDLEKSYLTEKSIKKLFFNYQKSDKIKLSFLNVIRLHTLIKPKMLGYIKTKDKDEADSKTFKENNKYKMQKTALRKTVDSVPCKESDNDNRELKNTPDYIFQVFKIKESELGLKTVDSLINPKSIRNSLNTNNNSARERCGLSLLKTNNFNGQTRLFTEGTELEQLPCQRNSVVKHGHGGLNINPNMPIGKVSKFYLESLPIPVSISERANFNRVKTQIRHIESSKDVKKDEPVKENCLPTLKRNEIKKATLISQATFFSTKYDYEGQPFNSNVSPTLKTPKMTNNRFLRHNESSIGLRVLSDAKMSQIYKSCNPFALPTLTSSMKTSEIPNPTTNISYHDLRDFKLKRDFTLGLKTVFAKDKASAYNKF